MLKKHVVFISLCAFFIAFFMPAQVIAQSGSQAFQHATDSLAEAFAERQTAIDAGAELNRQGELEYLDSFFEELKVWVGADAASAGSIDRGAEILIISYGDLATPVATSVALDDAIAAYNRGVEYSGKGDYDQAMAQFTEAIGIDANYTNAYNNRGVAYYKKGDYDKAIADYTAAIGLAPDYSNAYYNRGNAYFAKGDMDKAIADHAEAIRSNPNHADAYNNRGVAFSGKGDYDRAIADYTQAIRINPNHAKAYYNRGVRYSGAGDYDKAIADYTQAIRLDPNDTDAKQGLEAAQGARGY
jgi:tetratricopeptide (TPR) repeat protein